MDARNEEARPVGRSGFETAEAWDCTPKNSTSPDVIEARQTREASINAHLAAASRAELYQDCRRALRHLAAAIALVLTRDNPVAGHGARVAIARGGDA